MCFEVSQFEIVSCHEPGTDLNNGPPVLLKNPHHGSCSMAKLEQRFINIPQGTSPTGATEEAQPSLSFREGLEAKPEIR